MFVLVLSVALVQAGSSGALRELALRSCVSIMSSLAEWSSEGPSASNAAELLQPAATNAEVEGVLEGAVETKQ